MPPTDEIRADDGVAKLPDDPTGEITYVALEAGACRFNPLRKLVGERDELRAEVAALRTENDIAKSRVSQLGDHARHLMLIVRELRELGIDPPLVKLSEEGVTDAGMTLTDELSLIAINVDWDGAMSIRLDGNGVTNE